MPYIRKKRKKRYGWAVITFFAILFLWCIGVRIDTKNPWIVWRKENVLLYDFFYGKRAAGTPNQSLNQALLGEAIKTLPKEGFAGYSKDKIAKAYQQGKMKQMDERMVAKYKQQLQQYQQSKQRR